MADFILNFNSTFSNVDCSLHIHSEGGSGTTYLTGADEPFTIDEDDSTSLLDVIRNRTGIIRVVETSSGELAGLYPTSLTSHSVTFYYGNELFFSGYLQPTNSESPWTGCPRILEFPVTAGLGLLDSFNFDTIDISTKPRVSLREIITMVCSALGYRYYCVPSGYNTILDRTVNALAICPFNSNFANDRDNEPVFSPKTLRYGIEGVCRAMGWMLYEQCYDGDTMLLFKPFVDTGVYIRIDTQSSLDQTMPQSPDVTLTESMLMSDQGSETLIRPLKQVDVQYDGEYVESKQLPFERTTIGVIDGQDQEFVKEMFSCIFLHPTTDEVTGYYIDTPNRIERASSTSAVFNDYGVNMTYSGIGSSLKNQMLISFKVDGSQSEWPRSGTFMGFKFYEYPFGDVQVHMHISRTAFLMFDHIETLGVGNIDGSRDLTFRVYAKCGGLYFDCHNLAWTSSANITPIPAKFDTDTGDVDFFIKDVPIIGPLELRFALPRTPDINRVNDCGLQDKEVFSIDSFTISKKLGILTSYSSRKTNRDIVKPASGSLASDSPDSASVSFPFTFWRENTHQIGDIQKAGMPEFDYMFETKQLIKADFKLSGRIDTLHMDNYVLDGGTYKVLSYSFNPIRDTYRLSLMSL